MKKIFYILILITSNVFSQECDVIKVINDDVSGTTIITSQELKYENFTLNIVSGTRKGSYAKMIFKTNNECIDVYSKIYILFENGKRIETGNYVFDYNCNGNTGFFINNSKNENLLKNSVIKSIRIYTHNNSYQVDLTNEQSEELRSNVSCALDRKSWESKIKYKGKW